MEKPMPLYKVGNKVTVLSGGDPLQTTIESIRWDDNNACYVYYFKDLDGMMYCEFDSAIEPTIKS